MAGVLKEQLLDLAHNKVVVHDTTRLIQSGHSIAWEYLPGWEEHCHFKCDMELGIAKLVRTGQVDRACYTVLIQFLAGYSIAEIQIPNAREMLIQLLALLEQETKYTDDAFLHSVVSKYPKFEKTKEAYLNKLIEAGKTFE